MNKSKELYERAYYTGYRLTLEEENQLDSHWGMLYARNVVRRRLRGVLINETMQNSDYKEEYEAYNNNKKPAFDELLQEYTPVMYEDKPDQKKEKEHDTDVPPGSLVSVKATLIRDILDQLEDKFMCHPSEINTSEDFRRVADSGPDMKRYIILYLERPECCQHSAGRVRDSINTTDDGNEILQKLYLNGNEWF